MSQKQSKSVDQESGSASSPKKTPVRRAAAKPESDGAAAPAASGAGEVNEMGAPAPASRPRRRAATKPATAKPATAAPAARAEAVATAPPSRAADFATAADAARRRRVAEAAYLKAERRGFVGDHHEQDWLEAERELDAGRSPAAL